MLMLNKVAQWLLVQNWVLLGLYIFELSLSYWQYHNQTYNVITQAEILIQWDDKKSKSLILLLIHNVSPTYLHSIPTWL